MAGIKSGKLANKYKTKGLRVVAIDIDTTPYIDFAGSQEKWRKAGADFYLYTMEMNCFTHFKDSQKGYPQVYAIKEWERTDFWPCNEDKLKELFGF